jgi:hypothetical protein
MFAWAGRTRSTVVEMFVYHSVSDPESTSTSGQIGPCPADKPCEDALHRRLDDDHILIAEQLLLGLDNLEIMSAQSSIDLGQSLGFKQGVNIPASL